MKIKTKKQLNLPQLIEWAWDNSEQVECKVFQSDKMNTLGEYAEVHFSTDGHGFYTKGVTDIDTFTIEVEEEITEDTEIKTLVEVTEFGNIHTHMEATVKEEKRNSSLEFHALLDGRLVLIWTQDKGLVE